MTLRISNEEIDQVLGDVLEVFHKSVGADANAQPLRKDEIPGEEPDGDEEVPAPVPTNSGSPGVEGADDVDAENPIPPEAGEESADAERSPEGSPEGIPGEEGAEGGPPDMEALVNEYAQLPPQELELHYLATKQALMAVLGGAQGGASGPEGAPPSPPASGPAGPGGPPPEATPTLKSDRAAIAAKDAEIKALQEQLSKSNGRLSNVEKVIHLMTNRPLRKAITHISHVAKPGTEEKLDKSEVDVTKLSKSEVTERLNKAVRSPDMKKEDRRLVTAYMYNRANLDDIKHLLQ